MHLQECIDWLKGRSFCDLRSLFEGRYADSRMREGVGVTWIRLLIESWSISSTVHVLLCPRPD